MANKRIGVEAFFDTSAFEAGQRKFTDGLRGANEAAESVAGRMGGADGGGLFGGVAAGLGKVASIAAGAVVAGFAAAGTAAIAFGGVSINAAKDFQQQMSGVAAVSNASQEELKKLSDLALSLGADTALTVSTSQAAGVLETLARNGVTTGSILDGAARSAILLANASGASFETAADISSKAMSIFGISADQMEGAVNGITAVTNMSTFTIEDYALALAQGGGVAARVGVSFDDFNTAITALSSSFMSGSDAGTSLKTMLTRLSPQTDKAAALMDELGMNFFNADGSMKSLADVTQVLHDGLSGLTEEQKINAATTLFGADSMRAALALSEMTGDSFATLASQMSTVDAGDMAKTRVDNLAGALDIMGGAIETLQIRLGTLALPWLQTAALSAADAITGLGSQVEPLAAKMGELANYFIGAATGGDTVTTFLQGLPAPIQPIVEAVGNLLAAFGNSIPMIQTYISDMQATAVNAAATLGPQFGDKITDILNKLAAFWSAHGAEVMAIVNFLFRTVVAVVGVAMNTVLGIIDLAITAFTGIWAAGSKLLSGDWAGALDSIAITAGNLADILFTWAADTLDFVIKTFSGGTLELDTNWRNAFNGIIDFVRLWAPRIADGLTNAINAAIKAITDLAENWPTMGKAFVDGLVQGVTDAAWRLANAARDVINSAIQAAKDALGMHSPAREGIDIGYKGFGFGLELGILRSIPRVANAAGDAVMAAVSAASAIMAASTNGGYGGSSNSTTINNSRSLVVNVSTNQGAGGVVRSLKSASMLI